MKKKKNKKKSSRISNFFNKIKNSLFDESSYSKSTFSLFEVLIIVLISILFGVILGYVITITKNPVMGVFGNPKLNEVVRTYNEIVNDYYKDVDKNDLADAAIRGMINSLGDPYSNYMDQNTTDDFNEVVDGSFVGIGVSVLFKEHYNYIVEVNEDGPAKKAGLKVDDIILKVDGKDAYDLSGDNLTKLVRGKKGTKVKILVKRGEEEKKITVIRDVIEIPCVKEKTIEYEDKKVGYMAFSTFATNSYVQFKKALNKLEKDNIDALIIDVRNNPGGHLLQTKQILSLFFKKKTVLYQIASKTKTQKVYDNSSDKRSYPVVILINKGSASAAEILASSFRDNYSNSLIVGTTSYGKGTVQQSEELISGNSIKYTTQRWLTSKGNWLGEKGVKPDVEAELGAEYHDNPSMENDNVLQEALKQIKESM